jgi:CPA1 family monovalent cation:H+ antiporter
VSGVLAAVAVGLFISWRAHEIFSYRTRMQMNSFWETFVFLLNGLVFILIGLQLPEIMGDTGQHSLRDLIYYGLMISAVVIVTRLIWVFPSAHISNWIYKMMGVERAVVTETRYLLILGWSGMRGVVSLATALALPLTMADGTVFPERNTILFITFVVILVTLVFQGLTLPLLIKWLKVEEAPGKLVNEERRLRLAMANSAKTLIDDELTSKLDPEALANVRERMERQICYLNGILVSEKDSRASDGHLLHDYIESEVRIVERQRELLIQMHKKGVFTAEVLRKIERDLDARSMMLEGRLGAVK